MTLWNLEKCFSNICLSTFYMLKIHWQPHKAIVYVGYVYQHLPNLKLKLRRFSNIIYKHITPQPLEHEVTIYHAASRKPYCPHERIKQAIQTLAWFWKEFWPYTILENVSGTPQIFLGHTKNFWPRGSKKRVWSNWSEMW